MATAQDTPGVARICHNIPIFRQEQHIQSCPGLVEDLFAGLQLGTLQGLIEFFEFLFTFAAAEVLVKLSEDGCKSFSIVFLLKLRILG